MRWKRLIGHFHLHQDIAGKEFALGIDLAAAAHFDDLFSRHQDISSKRSSDKAFCLEPARESTSATFFSKFE
jgi:hypothetical protein